MLATILRNVLSGLICMGAVAVPPTQMTATETEIKTSRQACHAVVMVRPSCFCYNDQTGASNSFQSKEKELAGAEAQRRAEREFDDFVRLLQNHQIMVHVVQDTPTPHTPDSVFPNNWFSVHPDGRLITYPMLAPNRRLERSNALLEVVKNAYDIKEETDLTEWEQRGQFLEGTGSLVIDYDNEVLYACLSERTDQQLVELLADLLDYESVCFRGVDRQGKPIYHTNVLLAVGSHFAVLCEEAILDLQERRTVLSKLEETGHTVVKISPEQVEHFCGNVLEIANKSGKRFVAMSDEAYNSFSPAQRNILEAEATILHTPLPTIETLGGGSARCMLAGIYASAR